MLGLKRNQKVITPNGEGIIKDINQDFGFNIAYIIELNNGRSFVYHSSEVYTKEWFDYKKYIKMTNKEIAQKVTNIIFTQKDGSPDCDAFALQLFIEILNNPSKYSNAYRAGYYRFIKR